MDKQLLSTLEEWMAQGDPDAWLRAHPEHMEALSPYRDLTGTLQSKARAYCMISEPSGAAIATGEARLKAAVQSKATPTGFRHWSAPARAGAMVAVAVVALTLATGASALTGGGFGQAVLQLQACLTVINSDELFEKSRLCFVLERTRWIRLVVDGARNGWRGITLGDWWRGHAKANSRAGFKLLFEISSHGSSAFPVVGSRRPMGGSLFSHDQLWFIACT